MGQKVHPLGFRLVTTQKHRSVWFSEFANYPNFLEEDSLIREYLETKSTEAGISRIEIKRNGIGNKIEVEIYSARPGILVGNSGNGLSEIYKKLRKEGVSKPDASKIIGQQLDICKVLKKATKTNTCFQRKINK